ncbi:MAG TPA: hypothetical protein HPQ04_02475 [Rhodospirillaceae bacterium]|nr:hypothetical protein [Rhodospirillaceae bacterium]
MTQLDQIPVPTDGLRRMLVLLRAVIHEAGLQDREDLVEFSERCKVVVEDALRIGTN